MTYDLIPANKSWFRQAIRPVVSLDRWWLTYRFPFQKRTKVTYPPRMSRAEAETSDTLQHELVHVGWFDTWWGPWAIPLLVVFFPLPILFSGRWFVERPAYLADIRAGRHTVESAVEALWRGYLFPWPRSLMRRWFISQL